MRSLLLLSLVALAGCANTYSYRVDLDDANRRQQLTERAARREVTVRLIGQPGVQAQALSVRADSTSWVDPSTGSMRTVSTDELRSVLFPGSDASPLQGLALAVGTGVATGAVLGLLSYEFPAGPIDSRLDAAAFGASGGAIVGGLVGGVLVSDRRKSDLFIVRTPTTGR